MTELETKKQEFKALNQNFHDANDADEEDRLMGEIDRVSHEIRALENTAADRDTVRGVWARFRPQAYINDNAIDIDGGFMFDVTIQIEKMGREKALKITDHDYSADNLWHAYVAARPEKEHDGPFEIEVTDAIRKFYELDD